MHIKYLILVCISLLSCNNLSKSNVLPFKNNYKILKKIYSNTSLQNYDSIKSVKNLYFNNNFKHKKYMKNNSYINYKKLFSTTAITLLFISSYNSALAQQNNYSLKKASSHNIVYYEDKDPLIDENGSINPNLLNLLSIYNLNPEKNINIDSVNEIMQQNFLRNTKERDGIKDSPLDLNLKTKTIPLFRKMGYIDKIPDSIINCTHFLLFGAKIQRIQSRYKDFTRQYQNETLKTNNLVFLGGLRTLFNDELINLNKKKKKLNSFLKKYNKEEHELSEADLFIYTWDNENTESLKKEFIKEKNLFFINDTNSKMWKSYRPTTSSTLRYWLEYYPPKETTVYIHANVENPYGKRMKYTTINILKDFKFKSGTKIFYITWNSLEADIEKISIRTFLDTIARDFYEQRKLFKNSQQHSLVA